jgi:small-conductance mechanosensitive channel
MVFSLHKRFQAVLLLALLLCPGRLLAQAPQGAQSPATAPEQLPAVPELADLLPLAAALSGRLVSLEKTIAGGVALSWVEKQLAEISALVDAAAGRLRMLQASSDRRAGRLLELKVEIKNADDALAKISNPLTEKVRGLGNLRKAWFAEQQRWNAWRTVLLRDEPLEQVATTLSKVQGTIDTALDLLLQQLKPLLAIQEQAGYMQTRINTLTAEVEGLLSLTQGGVLVDAPPPMFSASYVAQLAAAISNGVYTSVAQVSWPGKSFFAQQGGIVALQGVLSVVLALVFFRRRQQLEQAEHWQFVAKRPLAAGLFVGIVTGAVCYRHPPTIVVLAWNVLGGGALLRLLAGWVEEGWRQRLVYGLVALVIMTNLFYAFGLLLPLFRLYILVAALVSLVCCLRWAAQSSHSQDAWQYAWRLRLGAVFFAAVLLLELWGKAELAEFLFASSLQTLGIVIAFSLLGRLVRGGLEWVVRSSSAHGVVLVRSNAAAIVQRLVLMCNVLIAVVLLAVLLRVWQVYDSPTEAILGLLAAGITIGSQRITVGLVIAAVGLIWVAYLASLVLQKLLTEDVLARHNVETGVSLSVARLVHYAVVTGGFVTAFVVLGVDLTKMTLLASALGVGIGFGLQTIVNNFVCGLILLFERPLRVGDIIEFGGRQAKIVKIGLRSTTVRTFDEADVIVPNTDLITNQVTNWTLTDRYARAMIAVGVAYGSDVALVMQTLQECALAHPGVMQNPAPQVLFQSFGDSALNFELRVWVANVDNRLQVTSDLHQDIDRRFRQAGIAIPFPQRDLHVRSVESTNNVAASVSIPLA